MGATTDYVVFEAKNLAAAEDAARKVIERARHEHGHGGYSGTLAEASGVEVLRSAPLTLAQAQDRLFGADGAAQKWGPGLLVRLEDGRWLFGAVCSS